MLTVKYGINLLITVPGTVPSTVRYCCLVPVPYYDLMLRLFEDQSIGMTV